MTTRRTRRIAFSTFIAHLVGSCATERRGREAVPCVFRLAARPISLVSRPATRISSPLTNHAEVTLHDGTLSPRSPRGAFLVEKSLDSFPSHVWRFNIAVAHHAFTPIAIVTNNTVPVSGRRAREEYEVPCRSTPPATEKLIWHADTS